MNTLEGRPNILITGAGSGLGRGLAQQLAPSTGRLFLADLRIEGVRETLSSLNGTSASAHAFDVSRSDDVKRLIEEIGPLRIDVLINNAGLQHVSPIETFAEAKWDQLLDVMLKGPFLLAQALIPRMREQNFGRIISIGSIHSQVASPFKSAYVSAKHGLVGLCKVLALETAANDITVNAICPSYIRTPLVDAQIKAQAEANKISEDDVIQKIMLEPMPKKAFIGIDEVAAAVRFLMSREAKNITGQAIVIDGGWTAR